MRPRQETHPQLERLAHDAKQRRAPVRHVHEFESANGLIPSLALHLRSVRLTGLEELVNRVRDTAA